MIEFTDCEKTLFLSMLRFMTGHSFFIKDGKRMNFVNPELNTEDIHMAFVVYSKHIFKDTKEFHEHAATFLEFEKKFSEFSTNFALDNAMDKILKNSTPKSDGNQ